MELSWVRAQILLSLPAFRILRPQAVGTRRPVMLEVTVVVLSH